MWHCRRKQQGSSFTVAFESQSMQYTSHQLYCLEVKWCSFCPDHVKLCCLLDTCPWNFQQPSHYQTLTLCYALHFASHCHASYAGWLMLHWHLLQCWGWAAWQGHVSANGLPEDGAWAAGLAGPAKSTLKMETAMQEASEKTSGIHSEEDWIMVKIWHKQQVQVPDHCLYCQVTACKAINGCQTTWFCGRMVQIWVACPWLLYEFQHSQMKEVNTCCNQVDHGAMRTAFW